MRPYLIHHFIEDSAESLPDKSCVSDANTSITYNEMVARSRKLGGLLSEFSPRKGEHIGIYLDKSVDQVLAIFGVFYAGGVIVLLNPILKTDQITHIIQDCGIQTVITSEKRMRKQSAIFQAAGVKNALVFRAKELLGFEKEMSIDDGFDSLTTEPPKHRILSDDTAHIIYTSGSTGMPKGIVLSHRNIIDGAKIVSQYTGLTSDDRMMGALPFNFDYGFNQLMNTVYIGASIVLHTFFLPNDLLHTLEQEKVTVFAGMTPIWTKLFNPKLTDLSRTYDLDPVRVVTNTGGKVPVPIVKKLQSLFTQARIFLMYGLTEAFRSTYLDPDELRNRPESIGKAIPDVEILVIDEHGKECGPGEEGELIHRGALISKGYWNNPEKTAQVFRETPLLAPENRHLETVVYSGDIVKKDKDGFITYIGRKDNMIKTKGYRVSPTEVEELVSRIDSVAECVATGYDTDEGINLRVFVLLSQDGIDEAQILLECKKHFPFYLVPDDLVICDRFPRTANGKVNRKAIIEEYGNG